MEQKNRLLRALQIKGAIATLTASIISLIFFSLYEAAGIIIGGAIGLLNFIILIRFVYTIISILAVLVGFTIILIITAIEGLRQARS